MTRLILAVILMAGCDPEIALKEEARAEPEAAGFEIWRAPGLLAIKNAGHGHVQCWFDDREPRNATPIFSPPLTPLQTAQIDFSWWPTMDVVPVICREVRR